MCLRIVTVGKMKDRSLQMIFSAYLERIQRLHDIRVSWARESRYKRESQDGVAIRQEEARNMLAEINPGAFCIALDENGEAMSSVAFSGLLERLLIFERREVVLVVGGFSGIDDAIYRRAQRQLSLSVMTLPHEIALVVLAEQIYRALTIIRRIPYHK